MSIRFAAIGLNHNHIYGQVDAVLRGGGVLVSFHAPEDELAAPFAERFPQAKRVAERRAILEDTTIDLVVTAAIPSERAPLALEAMRHGKDVMTDKPGATTRAQLDELRRVQAETRRIFSICYSEHFETRATVKAGELVRAGAIGEVVHTVGLGPHRINRPSRPGWFFERERYGGILTDIASHQCEQFLFFTDSLDGEVVAAAVANRHHHDAPGLQDVGEVMLRAGNASGYVRVDWFTPDGLPTWGDGRLFITGTEGSLELRKYVDIGGAPGTDHLILVDRTGVRRIDCADVALTYGPDLVRDIRDRTETAMPQERCFNAMALALEAQARAEAAGAPPGAAGRLSARRDGARG
jgi:predicted dehydrogenase